MYLLIQLSLNENYILEIKIQELNRKKENQFDI